MLEADSVSISSPVDVDLRISLVDYDDKKAYSMYKEGYLSFIKDSDYRTYTPQIQENSMKTDCSSVSSVSHISTHCADYDYSQPREFSSYTQKSVLRKKQQSLHLKGNNYKSSNFVHSDKSLLKKWHENTTKSSDMHIINIPRLNPPSLLPTPSMQPFGVSDCPVHRSQLDNTNSVQNMNWKIPKRF
ncbi:unnamed protein product [Heterobilharzia americana]|nr:unnamed protein product [Heterobilharzia americana]